MSIDQFLDRRLSPEYNCLNFAREVWLAMMGQDIKDKLTRLVGAFADRRGSITDLRGFLRLQEPVNPCFVVLQRFRFTPHVGIFLDGRVLHLTDKGVQFQPLVVALGYFTDVRYYEWIR